MTFCGGKNVEKLFTKSDGKFVSFDCDFDETSIEK